MKTAVSVPDEIFSQAEQLAAHLDMSRSELYSRAVSEYVCRHSPDTITEALNRVCATVQHEAGHHETVQREAGHHEVEHHEAEPTYRIAARKLLKVAEW